MQDLGIQRAHCTVWRGSYPASTPDAVIRDRRMLMTLAGTHIEPAGRWPDPAILDKRRLNAPPHTSRHEGATNPLPGRQRLGLTVPNRLGQLGSTIRRDQVEERSRAIGGINAISDDNQTGPMITQDAEDFEKVVQRSARQVAGSGHHHLIDAIKRTEEGIPTEIASPAWNGCGVIRERRHDDIATGLNRLRQTVGKLIGGSRRMGLIRDIDDGSAVHGERVTTELGFVEFVPIGIYGVGAVLWSNASTQAITVQDGHQEPTRHEAAVGRPATAGGL